MSSLRGYLMAMAITLVVLLCLATAVLVRQLEAFGQSQVEQQLLETTRAMSLAMDGQLQAYLASLRALGQSEALDRRDWPAFDRQARALFSGPDAWIVLSDPQARQLINTRLPPGAGLPPGQIPQEMWSTIRQGQPHVCNLVHGQTDAQLTCVDLPVIQGGRTAYALSLMFRPRVLQGIIEQQRLRPGWRATVLDRRGALIWRNTRAEKYMGRTARPDLLAAIARHKEAVTRRSSLEGVPNLMSFSRSPLSGWTILVAAPQQEVGAGAARTLRDGLIVAALSVLLAATLGVLVGRRVAKAVGHLQAAAQRIGSGKPATYQPSGIREIDAVGAVLESAIGERDANKERFDLAQEVGGIGAWEWDMLEDEGYVSDTYKQMHGLSHVHGLLRIAQVLAVIHPDDLEGYKARLAAAKLRREASHNHYRVVHADGSIRWIAAKGRPQFGEGGRLVGGIGIVRDATAEREAEEALRDSQMRLALATEAGEIGVWDWDVRADRLIHSPLSRAILGLPGDAPLTLQCGLSTIHAEDRARVDEKIRCALDPDCRDRSPYDYRVWTPGGLRWVLVHGRVQFEGPEGQERATRYTGTVIDITERKEAEQTLRRLNHLLEQRIEERTAERDNLWSLSRDPFLIADLDGVWLTASPAWTELLGWPPDELVGRSSEWMEHPDDRVRTRAEVCRLAQGAVTDRFENRLRARDGDYRALAWSAVAEGERIYAVARDVTAEREQASALMKTQEALRQSQKMESIGQITGGVAHDFNNLLGPIVGALDLLQERGLPDPRSERMVAGAVEAAERARTLVQRLLAFARRQPLAPGAVDVGALMFGLKHLLASTLGPQTHMELSAAEGLPPALADANQLELAILNLAVNARDAMPAGGRFSIAVSAETAEADHVAGLKEGRYIAIQVVDTGMGMPAAVLERAVEPFFSTKGVGRGTGLGLSMVHGLTAQLGGGMRIASVVGEGTTIRLWLPLAPSEATAALQPRARTAPVTGQGVALLVDDEVLVRASTAQMLSELGYHVVSAESAEKALRLLAGRTIDVLVTDHLMPGMTGVELARQFRQKHAHAAVLIISGYADVDDIAADLPRLSKPFRKAELAEALARAKAE